MITIICFVSSESASYVSEQQFSSELEFKNWLIDNGYQRYHPTEVSNCKEHDIYHKEVNEVEYWVVCKKSS